MNHSKKKKICIFTKHNGCNRIGRNHRIKIFSSWNLLRDCNIIESHFKEFGSLTSTQKAAAQLKNQEVGSTEVIGQMGRDQVLLLLLDKINEGLQALTLCSELPQHRHYSYHSILKKHLPVTKQQWIQLQIWFAFNNFSFESFLEWLM